MTGPTAAEIRASAYGMVAGALIGDPYPGDQFEDALAVVLSDTRQGRTKAERALQTHVAIALTTWAIVNRPELLSDYATRLRIIMDEAIASALGEEVTP